MIIKYQRTHVLVADDDPITLAFFQATLEQIGCEVSVARTGSQAVQLTQNDTFDLLLLDRRMPDLGGIELLAALRGKGIESAAIATSADVDAATMRELRNGGFVGVVTKPLTQAQLIDALRTYRTTAQNCASIRPEEPPMLDDAEALAASGGDPVIMHKLRVLLLTELQRLPDEIAECSVQVNQAGLHERLHRLKASCGFCGASALAQAAVQLDLAMCNSPHNANAMLSQLLQVCAATVTELQRQGMPTPAEA